MDIKIQIAADYAVSRWSGGSTTQLYIFPHGADYARRDFAFRLSSATVECDFSQFTALPDVQREIMMLDGEIDLCVDGEVTHLGQYDKHSFSGGSDTTSTGKAIDFNLMLIGAKGTIKPLEIGAQTSLECGQEFTFAFVDRGECTVLANGAEYALAEKSSIMCRGIGTIAFTAELGAHCILAEITPDQ